MLGQPVSMLVPQVVGFKLTGSLPEGATATDLVLTVDPDAEEKGGGRQVRRVLRHADWPVCRWPTGPRSRTWPPSTARPAACSRSTPRRSAISSCPAGRPALIAAGRGLRQGTGDVSHGRLAGGRVFGHARARPLDRRAQPGRAAASARPGAAARFKDRRSRPHSKSCNRRRSGEEGAGRRRCRSSSGSLPRVGVRRSGLSDRGRSRRRRPKLPRSPTARS